MKSQPPHLHGDHVPAKSLRQTLGDKITHFRQSPNYRLNLAIVVASAAAITGIIVNLAYGYYLDCLSLTAISTAIALVMTGFALIPLKTIKYWWRSVIAMATLVIHAFIQNLMFASYPKHLHTICAISAVVIFPFLFGVGLAILSKEDVHLWPSSSTTPKSPKHNDQS